MSQECFSDFNFYSFVLTRFRTKERGAKTQMHHRGIEGSNYRRIYLRPRTPPEVTRSTSSLQIQRHRDAEHGTIHLVPSGHSDYWFHARAKESNPCCRVSSLRPVTRARSLARFPFLHLVSSRKRKLTPLRFFVHLSLRYGT